ncbi:MAG: cytochrome b/b6 domain-containing protein [Dehalococcoidales bacterium]|nr:cytochrome b/b6 domain-containing protein [Dehalococcoidales bacterium]
MEGDVERYRKPTRILHWFHTGAFITLFLTGLILYVPPLAIIAQDSWTRIIHRIAAVIFIIGPLLYLVFNYKAALKGITEAFHWGQEDLGWLLAAPRYYFLNDEEAMPPQGHMNTGQKMWWLMVIVFSAVFVVTGIVMAFLKTVAPAVILQWSVVLHDIAFIATGAMFFVHVYLSVIHPLMRPLRTGAWSSMARGKVSVEYARSHHAKWYQEIASGQDEPGK